MADFKRLTPLKAIRAKCLDCCVFSKDEVKKCTAIECPLWMYRLGKITPKTLTFTLEQKKLWDARGRDEV